MEKVATIETIKWVPGWQGNTDTLFFHEITMDNGDHGKLAGNKQEKPNWLKENTKVKYDFFMPQGKDTMYIKFLGIIGAARTNSASEEYPDNHNNGSTMENPKKKSWGNRLDDDPEYALKKQKCISLTTCLERANNLVVAGKIKLEDKYTEALTDFNFILKYSGLDAEVAVPASKRRKLRAGKKDEEEKENSEITFPANDKAEGKKK